MPRVGPLELLLILMIVAAVVVPYWKISRKLGYPGALGILMVIPLVSLVVLWVAALAKWPIERELEQLRETSSKR